MMERRRCTQCGLVFKRVRVETECPWCGSMTDPIVHRVAPCPAFRQFRSFVDDRPTGRPILYTSRKRWLADLHAAGYTSVHFEGKHDTDNTGLKPKETLRDFAETVDKDLLHLAAKARPETEQEARAWSERKLNELKAKGGT